MAGFVWLEMAPKESLKGFLKLPRSEDIARRGGQIYRKLKELGFFDALGKRLGVSPGKSCGGDFGLTVAALASMKASSSLVRDAKLLFIGYGAYCDCQVLESVAPALAGE